MKTARSMVWSGIATVLISFSANAETQSELEARYARNTGATQISAHELFQKWEDALKSELAAKKAVHIEGLGTFKPIEYAGTKNGSNPRTGAIQIRESWKLVKNPEVISDMDWRQRMADAGKMTLAESDAVREIYRSSVARELTNGGRVKVAGLGYFAGTEHATKIKCTKKGVCKTTQAYKQPVFNDEKGQHIKFVPDDTLKLLINNAPLS